MHPELARLIANDRSRNHVDEARPRIIRKKRS